MPLNTFIGFNYFTNDQMFSGTEFELSSVGISVNTRPRDGLGYGVQISKGDQIDFANVQRGDQFRFGHNLSYNITHQLLIRLSQSYQTLDVRGGELFQTVLTDLRLSYQFSRASSLRLSLIHQDTIRDTSLYGFTIDERSKRLDSQLLYSYQLNPQTVFFAGYSTSGLDDDALPGISKTSDSVFVKFSYAWIL